MIVNFRSKVAQDIYDGDLSRYARKISLELHRKIRRLFDQINSANAHNDLRVPSSNRLEQLKGDLVGKWSIRVNNQWRIVFVWQENDAFDVKIVDYH